MEKTLTSYVSCLSEFKYTDEFMVFKVGRIMIILGISQ